MPGEEGAHREAGTMQAETAIKVIQTRDPGLVASKRKKLGEERGADSSLQSLERSAHASV